MRLTYAVHDDLVQETEIASEYMWGFAPEVMYLVMCGNRTIFLKDKARLEVDAYRRFASNLICNYGTSEIYCHHGKGGILNSALVAVGLREGEAWLKVCADTSSQRKVRDVIPLSERMAAFLDAVTEELRESNRELKSMAEAAGLAGGGPGHRRQGGGRSLWFGGGLSGCIEGLCRSHRQWYRRNRAVL